MKRYYVYILTNTERGVLYIGITNDPIRRIWEHRQGHGSVFVQKYKLYRLVYVEEFSHVNDARQRERTLKHWKRDWKIQLIEAQNPTWDDLSQG